MQQKQAAHAVSLYFDLCQASTFDRPSVSCPATVLHKVEVSEIKLPIQCTVSSEPQAGAVPLVVKLPNGVCVQSPYPLGLPLSPAIATDTMQPMTGASWVVQFTRLVEEIQVRHYSRKTLKTTMIYTHTVKSVTIKEAKSPLDLC